MQIKLLHHRAKYLHKLSAVCMSYTQVSGDGETACSAASLSESIKPTLDAMASSVKIPRYLSHVKSLSAACSLQKAVGIFERELREQRGFGTLGTSKGLQCTNAEHGVTWLWRGPMRGLGQMRPDY